MKTSISGTALLLIISALLCSACTTISNLSHSIAGINTYSEIINNFDRFNFTESRSICRRNFRKYLEIPEESQFGKMFYNRRIVDSSIITEIMEKYKNLKVRLSLDKEVKKMSYFALKTELKRTNELEELAESSLMSEHEDKDIRYEINSIKTYFKDRFYSNIENRKKALKELISKYKEADRKDQ